MKKITALTVIPIFILLSFFGSACTHNTSMPNTLEVSGIIESVKTDIRARVMGEVEKTLVQEGQTVKKGDILCLIDDRIPILQLEQIQEGIEGDMAKLRLFQKGTKKELIAVAKNQLDAAAKEYEIALKNQERIVKLYKEGAVSEDKKEKGDLQMKIALERYEIASENFRLASRGREAEEIDIVRAEIKSLQSQAQLIRYQIEDSHVTSPINGFLETRHIEKGEYIRPGVMLFSIIDPDKTYVKAYVPEKYLGNISIHSQVSVICDSFPDKIFEGNIDYISNQAEFAPKNIQTKEERLKLVFMVKSYIKNRDRLLKPGMPVDVVIRLNNELKQDSP